jgi:anti-anti-sigma regulatory factor
MIKDFLTMTSRSKTVVVRELPAKLDRHSETVLLNDLRAAMNVERPAVVLDCSRMREMDVRAIHLLLCCLEEAMKRNGDVRLAAVSPVAKESLRGLHIDQLYRIFETSEQAVDSFQRRGTFVAPLGATAANVPAENAA